MLVLGWWGETSDFTGLKRIAGVDVSFFSDGTYAIATVVVLSFPRWVWLGCWMMPFPIGFSNIMCWWKCMVWMYRKISISRFIFSRFFLRFNPKDLEHVELITTSISQKSFSTPRQLVTFPWPCVPWAPYRLQVLWERSAAFRLSVPYVPGFLAFREATELTDGLIRWVDGKIWHKKGRFRLPSLVCMYINIYIYTPVFLDNRYYIPYMYIYW